MSYPHRRHSRQNYLSRNRRKETEPAIFDIMRPKTPSNGLGTTRKMLRELWRELSHNTLDELLCPELHGDAPSDKP